MKKIFLFAALLAALSFFQYGVEKIVLKDGFDFEAQMAENEVFLKYCIDFEFLPGSNLVFFLDRRYSQVFKLEWRTGKLLKTISSKGQGPREMQDPVSMKIKNNQIFILDRGFNGIKVFDLDGKFVKEFRLNSTVGGHRNIDVNDKNEIFLGKPDYNAKTMVSVFDTSGKKLRSFIPFQFAEKKRKNAGVSREQYLIKLDSQGNVLLLYYMLRKLAKHDPRGRLLWETDITNEILDKLPKDESIVSNGKTTTRNYYIFNFDVLENDGVAIGHAGGGCIYSKDGKLKKLVLVQEKIGENQQYYNLKLGLFKIRKNTLINAVAFGRSIYYYPFK